jgi:hypothetical protein
VSETRFTPGPWRYVPKDGRSNQSVVVLEEIIADYSPDRPLATVTVTAWKPDGYKSAVANAQLIAAAPELYEALKAMVQWDALRDPNKPPPIADAIAALNKARGLAGSGAER